MESKTKGQRDKGGESAGARPGAPEVPSRAAFVDRLMERASVALEATEYFEAERLAAQALQRAHQAGDFEAMTRILLPLQEARRQKRQAAVECGNRFVVSDLRTVDDIRPGCYMIQPPLLGVDARSFRETADGMRVPVLAIAREPLTRESKWPVVAVGDGISLRVRIEPPYAVTRIEASKTKDESGMPGAPAPSREWFEFAEEAIGDAGLLKLKADEPAAWRVDDLVRFVDAHPSHEKLHQRLAQECLAALRENIPEEQRHRPPMSDPFGF